MISKIEILKQDLLDYYNIMELSVPQIATIYDCDPSTIYRRMVKYNIPRRTKSEMQQGKKNHMYGKIRPLFKRKIEGEKSGRWKGEEAGYVAIHTHIRKNKIKPKNCEICGENKILELSNKDHKYRRNIEDYQYLCKKCHAQYDLKKGFRYNKINRGIKL